MSFLTYAIAAKLERGTHLLDTLVREQDIPKDQLERDLNTLQFNASTLLKAELIERDFDKAVDVLFTKRLVARGNASYGVEIEGEERVIESLKLVHQVTNDDIYQSGLQSLAYHLGSRKLIETTNAVVLGGDIELTDDEYDFEKPYTDETITAVLDQELADTKTVSEKEAVFEQATSEQGTSEQATSEQSEQAPFEQVTSEQATSEQATSEQATSEDVTNEQDSLDVEPLVDASLEQTSESEIQDVTSSETATEVATKPLPFTSEELDAYAKEIVERGNKLAKDAEQKADAVNEVPDFGHSETSDVLAVLDTLDDTSDKTSEHVESTVEHVTSTASSDVVLSEADSLNEMIDSISTTLTTSEKPVLDVTPSEGPSVDGVVKAFGGSLDGASLVSNLGRLHDVGQPIASQLAR